MHIKALLFDLDGTLLDYDMRKDFVPHYLEGLAAHVGSLVPPKKLTDSILRSSEAIIKGDGRRTNEQVFADTFYPMVGVARETLEPRLMDFYEEGFPKLSRYTNPKPEARQVMQSAFDLGYCVVIATNPHFPATAVQQRLAWAGVADFPYRKVTSYENSHFAKPRLEYYQEILNEIGCAPEEALVIGDEAMDMVAARLGCPTFLVSSPATVREAIVPEPTYSGDLMAVEVLLRHWAAEKKECN